MKFLAENSSWQSPAKWQRETWLRFAHVLLFASDISYNPLFASEVSWLSPQAVVPWITFNPNSSWASDKETRCLPQDSGLLCKGNYLKVWCAAQALNWIQPVICSTIGWPSRAFYSTTWKQMQKKWQCSTTKLFYWLYKLPHSTALGWLWIFQCSAPLHFHI